MTRSRKTFIWLALTAAIAIPVAAAAMSPQLAWRDPVYIAAGFAGISAMCILLLQPLLAGGYLPNLTPRRTRQAHRLLGSVLMLAILVHVGGLWITSPPDVMDALLLRSATPFSIWGVLAMWTVFAAALLAFVKRSLRLRPRVWRSYHFTLAAATVVGSIAHALMIEGTMETISKTILCALVAAATMKLAFDLLRRSSSQ